MLFFRSAASYKNMVKTKENKRKHVFSCFCSVYFPLVSEKSSMLFF